jgi:hypothetical protein
VIEENSPRPRRGATKVTVTCGIMPAMTAPRRAKGRGGRPHKGAREFLGFRVRVPLAEAVDGARARLGAYRSDWIAAALTVAQGRKRAVAAAVQQPVQGAEREYLATRVVPALFADVEHAREQYSVHRNAWIEAALTIALEHEDEVATTWRHALAREQTQRAGKARRAQIALDRKEAYSHTA